MIGRTLGFYFGRRFLGSVLGIFVGCVFLIMLVDFLEMARRVGERDVDTTTLLLLILYRAPFFTEQLLPFAVLFGAIGTFLTLSRRLELVVARAAGISAWQFIGPAALAAVTLGVLSTTVYNPMSADLQGTGEPDRGADLQPPDRAVLRLEQRLLDPPAERRRPGHHPGRRQGRWRTRALRRHRVRVRPEGRAHRTHRGAQREARIRCLDTERGPRAHPEHRGADL